MNKQFNNDSQTRMMRGHDLLKQGINIQEQEDGSFAVPSLTRNIVYEVKVLESIWVCSCPDFQYREVEFCKHIIATKMWIATRHIQNKPKPKVFANDSIQCDKCGSIRVMKYGHSANKQVYKCKDCHRKFRYSSLKKVKFSPELITLSLDLYFSGLSLRKISRNVNDHFDINLNFSTIYTWIQRYIPLISNYVNSLKPQLGDTWHADELFVKLKEGEKERRGDTKIAYLWNIMDKESRFLIASKLSKHRNVEGCIQAFNEAIHNSHGQMPQKVHTDSHRAYVDGLKVFGGVEHIAKCGINKPHSNNNKIERLNGTLRERTKVQRGWKSKKSAIAEGQRIYYNFVKPHEILYGKTPAEKAGIIAKNRNKWLDLLRKSKQQ